MAQRRRVVHRFCVLFNVSINRIFIHERKDELHFSLTGPSTRKSVTTAASRCTATNLHLYENFCRHIHPPQTSYYPIMWHTQILACLFNRKPIYCTSCRLANFTQILRKEKFLLPTSSTRKLFSNHHVFFSVEECMHVYIRKICCTLTLTATSLPQKVFLEIEFTTGCVVAPLVHDGR